MLKALEQARLGRGLCAPNPAVGAVIVQDGKIIAEGWHKGAGKAHAEQLALEQLPDDATNLTLYVTLEPCNHWGRTPPCALAICKSAVTKVVYGFRDPNPVVAANDTPKILEQQGIEVLHLPLTEIDDFYASYLYWTKTKMPWVTAKIAHSMDGKIGLAQQIVHLTNSECQYLTHTKRWQTDVILTTAKTIHADNPRLNARLDGQELKKHVAILDRELSLISKTGTPAQIFSQALHCHFFYDQGLPAPSPRDNCSYHPVATIGSKLDLAAVVHYLGHLGFHDVWVEAGGLLFSALHAAHLVQTTYIYIAPHVIGKAGVEAYCDTSFYDRPHTTQWQVVADNVIACIQWSEAQ